MSLDELERFHSEGISGIRDAHYIATLHNAFPALLALARDGERYRWLRNSATWKQATAVLNDSPQGIDAAIDAAMKERT